MFVCSDNVPLTVLSAMSHLFIRQRDSINWARNEVETHTASVSFYLQSTNLIQDASKKKKKNTWLFLKFENQRTSYAPLSFWPSSQWCLEFSWEALVSATPNCGSGIIYQNTVAYSYTTWFPVAFSKTWCFWPQYSAIFGIKMASRWISEGQ